MQLHLICSLRKKQRSGEPLRVLLNCTAHSAQEMGGAILAAPHFQSGSRKNGQRKSGRASKNRCGDLARSGASDQFDHFRKVLCSLFHALLKRGLCQSIFSEFWKNPSIHERPSLRKIAGGARNRQPPYSDFIRYKRSAHCGSF
jgi:hypothetical protein